MTLTEKLLKWYAKNGRDLPWRVKGRAHDDPYAVWVSEIMLQQTTVKTVLPYFARFMKRFPDVFALASAPLDEVLLYWQGLGYYTRARKMHECAKTLVDSYQGRFPADRDELQKLPGIGAYTSAAILSFGFNLPHAVVDGNVIRVLTRLKGWASPVSDIQKDIAALAQELTSETRAADYSSAIMDLGATVCTPAHPDCPACPWQSDCVAFKQHKTAEIPNIVKPEKTVKKGYVFLISDDKNRFYLRKRTEKGLLSGLTEFPWNTDESFPFNADWNVSEKTVKHTFTHFTLLLTLVFLRKNDPPVDLGGRFVAVTDFPSYPFSTLMEKVVKKGGLHEKTPVDH